MSLLLRRFLTTDRPLLGKLKSEARDCINLLFNRGHADRLFLVEASYGAKLWSDRHFLVTNGGVAFKQPVGLVLDGTLEVTEKFGRGDVVRQRTTKILHPGDFFGLFEAFGRLYGQWEITAGVQRFLVSNPLGNSKSLRDPSWSWASELQLYTLQHRATATFDYSELIRYLVGAEEFGEDNTSNVWRATVLVFDQAEVKDNEAILLLYREAVTQLVSLARQNPTEGLFEEVAPAKANAEEQRAAATLDAILADHVPVFAPCRQAHERYGPFAKLLEGVGRLVRSAANGSVGPPVRLWVPEYWSKVEGPGALYVDTLARRFDMSHADSLLSKGRTLRSGTVIKTHVGREWWTARVTTTDGRSAIVRRLAVKRQTQRIPAKQHAALFGSTRSGAKGAYGWPLHLTNGLFFQRAK